MSEITQEQLAYFKEAVAVSPKADALRNAVTTNGILQAARDNRRAGELTPVFSVDLESSPVANQLQSGRCWMFAALNTMRHDMKALYGLPGGLRVVTKLYVLLGQVGESKLLLQQHRGYG